VRRSTWLLAFYVITYVLYLFVGAWAMWFLEVDHENLLRCVSFFTICLISTRVYVSIRKEVYKAKEDFLSKHPEISGEQ
jgi:hypothetical protein